MLLCLMSVLQWHQASMVWKQVQNSFGRQDKPGRPLLQHSMYCRAGMAPCVQTETRGGDAGTCRGSLQGKQMARGYPKRSFCSPLGWEGLSPGLSIQPHVGQAFLPSYTTDRQNLVSSGSHHAACCTAQQQKLASVDEQSQSACKAQKHAYTLNSCCPTSNWAAI